MDKNSELVCSSQHSTRNTLASSIFYQMLPKKYFDNNKLPIDYNYVFVLLREEFLETYDEYIKKPLEDNSLKCESAFDIKAPGEIMDDLWKRIQQAHIIIIDISGFTPNLMYELGVVLTVKDRVIVICDENESDLKELPFNIGHVRVLKFQMHELEAFSHQIIYQVNEIASEGKDITEPEYLSEEVKGWVQDAERAIAKEERLSSALGLLQMADMKEPDHWYIHMQWGFALALDNKTEKGIETLQRALSLAKFNPQQALVLMKIALVHQLNKSYDRADGMFRKAEDKNSSNPELYTLWADLFDERKLYLDASEKIAKAIKLSNRDLDKMKNQYFSQMISDPKAFASFETYVASKNSKNQVSKQRYQPRHAFESYIAKHKLKSSVEGIIDSIHPDLGVFVQLDEGFNGLVKSQFLPKDYYFHRHYKRGQKVTVRLNYFHYDTQKIDLKFI